MTKHDKQFKSGSSHPKWVDKTELLTFLRAMDLGTLQIIGNEIEYKERSRSCVRTRCGECGREALHDVHNIKARKTTNCKCQRAKKYNDERAQIYGERYDAMKQRCENPLNPNYDNYGGRYIERRIERRDYIEYLLAKYPNVWDLENYDVDRIDNNGHYEAGNLRLVTRAENARNRYNTKVVMWKKKSIAAIDLASVLKREFPNLLLSNATIYRLAKDGVSVADILKRKPRGPYKRKIEMVSDGGVVAITCRVRQRPLTIK